MHRHASASAAHRPRPSVVGGLIARMRDWFVASAPAAPHDTLAIPRFAPIANAKGRLSVETSRPTGASIVVRPEEFAHASTVVPLPLNGRRLLIQLAQELGARFTRTSVPGDDPLLLTLTTGSQQRLWIDSTAHVDVRDDQLPYRVVLGDVLTTRVILETSDFAEVTNFVRQYLLLTRGEASFTGGGAA